MIYAESFRHFCMEWIEIQHPEDKSDWPWDPRSSLYLINLYALPSSELITSLPTPFVSILLDKVDRLRESMIGDRCLYARYFDEDGSFALPRRYLFNPLNRGERNIHLNRYSFSPNTYGEMASDWNSPDMILLRVLANRPHVRYSTYVTGEYQILQDRLHKLEERTGATIHYAENLLDCTSYVTSEQADFRQKSPETMIIAAPITGILKPVRKSKEYRIINGVLGMCTDEVRLAIEEEPCFDDYEAIRIPFQRYYRNQFHAAAGEPNNAKAVVYILAEVPGGIFSFQEFTPNATIVSRDSKYVRLLNHSFTIKPEQSRINGKVEGEVRLHHEIQEGLIPYIKENQKYLQKHYEKLFYRSDMPSGIYKTPDGKIVTTIYPGKEKP